MMGLLDEVIECFICENEGIDRFTSQLKAMKTQLTEYNIC